jgi:hypothetical protein
MYMSTESENPSPFWGGSFRPDLSDVWQNEVIRVIGRLANQLRQFTFGTQAKSDTLIVRFAPLEEATALIKARLEGDNDFLIEGHVEFRYWCHYGDYLDENEKEMPADENLKDLLRQKEMAFQFDWPILEIVQGALSQGPFLNRVTKTQLRSSVREAILQEMFDCGYIDSAKGENGPFQTLDGKRI